MDFKIFGLRVFGINPIITGFEHKLASVSAIHGRGVVCIL
jgi:hypothetical protein